MPTAPGAGSRDSSTRRRRRKVVGGVEILSARVRRELERHVADYESVMVCVRGCLSHSLIALDRRLLIVKPGIHAGTAFGSLTTTFYYEDVTGLQLNTFILTGWIEISSASFQGREQKRDSDRDIYKLPNCIPISKRRLTEVQEALGRLRELIEVCKHHGHVVSDAPLIGTLERISNLRRTGALSEQEYDQLKQVVLATATASNGAGLIE